MKNNNLMLIMAVAIFSLQVINFVYDKKSEELLAIQNQLAFQSLQSSIDGHLLPKGKEHKFDIEKVRGIIEKHRENKTN